MAGEDLVAVLPDDEQLAVGAHATVTPRAVELTSIVRTRLNVLVPLRRR